MLILSEPHEFLFYVLRKFSWDSNFLVPLPLSLHFYYFSYLHYQTLRIFWIPYSSLISYIINFILSFIFHPISPLHHPTSPLISTPLIFPLRPHSTLPILWRVGGPATLSHSLTFLTRNPLPRSLQTTPPPHPMPLIYHQHLHFSHFPLHYPFPFLVPSSPKVKPILHYPFS
jgi:hypothetical protein